ncbi:unnamed protein product [Aphanomyces euteiches]|uniref:Uncharacterized protein n=1 Tax=Aphanomyces euteiches TaxID=100861 RepID=A0A6G0W9Z2_9STRA|nr:hypothetical protein Ae201684_017193 [Aphanomyces euteiches]KAH9078759.1 hypothetical protein Ae201684P_019833 [Aphanomyces euteiches]
MKPNGLQSLDDILEFTPNMPKANAVREIATAVVLALTAGAAWKSYAVADLKSFDDYYKSLKTQEKAPANDDE